MSRPSSLAPICQSYRVPSPFYQFANGSPAQLVSVTPLTTVALPSILVTLAACFEAVAVGSVSDEPERLAVTPFVSDVAPIERTVANGSETEVEVGFASEDPVFESNVELGFVAVKPVGREVAVIWVESV